MSNEDTLNFHDLVILKQFIEKGFRENLFNSREMPGAKLEHTKLSNIILQVTEKSTADTVTQEVTANVQEAVN